VFDRERFLHKGVEALSNSFGVNVLEVSSFYSTVAVSSVQQPDFLNGVIYVTTSLTPFELLTLTQRIERDCGRESKGDYQPRCLDLDILIYGHTILSDVELTIPHPLMHERVFVIKPLAEIASDLVHPVLNQSIGEIYEGLEGY
jgi:2-amino-4-hydroxy-6-hydroxymethyldihydropteridine diphosphokinase